ncbi:MAG: M24 family metallopeptidase [Candidatus Aminicenantes bacterium]|nr:M24 family metallopeptidase [Candidatus Aminicenantes bacterium]
MKKTIISAIGICVLTAILSAAQIDLPSGQGRDIDNILSQRRQAEVYNEIVAWRLDNILPRIMRREGIDLWLVICFEYAEDPVFMSLTTRPRMSARRLSILLFHDTPDGFKKFTASWHGPSACGPMYTALFTSAYRQKGADGQLLAVADYIKKADPKKIGINYAEHWDYFDDFSHGLGLSAFFKAKLEQALDPKYKARLVSAENVCAGWYETRSPAELSLYRHLAGIGHDLIREFFSNAVITPDVTTTADVEWWFRERVARLGLEAWFQPSIDIRRSPEDAAKFSKGDDVIRRGDLLHCDVGFRYLELATDMQHNAYVLRQGEADAPQGLKDLLRKGNRLQEILLGEMKEGRKGNEILVAALAKAKAEGIEGSIYAHPIGFYGHGSGVMLGMPEKQSFVPGTGERVLSPNMVHSIELSVSHAVPEWGNTRVSTGFEDEAIFTKDGARWANGYPTMLYLIK